MGSITEIDSIILSTYGQVDGAGWMGAPRILWAGYIEVKS